MELSVKSHTDIKEKEKEMPVVNTWCEQRVGIILS